MILQLDLLYDENVFSVLLFFILLIISYVIAKFINLEKNSSILAIHVFISILFVVLGLIDYYFIIFSVIELAIIIKMLGGYENEIN